MTDEELAEKSFFVKEFGYKLCRNERSYKEGFLDGLNTERLKWHNLRKNETSGMCSASQNRIDELEAALTEQKQYTAFKCAQAKEKIEALEKEKCELLGIIQGKDKAIADLKKENADLQKHRDKDNDLL